MMSASVAPASGLALCVAVSACSLAVPTPQARARRGPAFAESPSKLIALPASCSGDFGEACNAAHQRAVDIAARMALEYAGYRIVDSERVNAELRRRMEISRESGDGKYVSRSSSLAIEGLTFADASPVDQRRLLGEMGVDGVLSTHIYVGPVKNVEGQRTIDVSVTVARARDRLPVWTARCAVETGRFNSDDQAVGAAATCALESAALLGEG